MDWDFKAEQIIDGEMELTLTDFTGKLYEKSADTVAMSIEIVSGGEPLIDHSLDPLEDYRIQFFICYYNFLLARATDRSNRQFISFTKKMNIDSTIKVKFTDKKYLESIVESTEETVDIFKAVLKRFISELMESGTSNSRLPQMLYMQQLNSFSSIIPNIMRNENARELLLHIEFNTGIMGGRFKKLLGG